MKWDRCAEKEGCRHYVFCASMADVMDDEVPQEWRERLWKLIDSTPNLIWQLLTKRPHRYERYLPQSGFWLNNVALGTTCENQHYYDSRWPVLYLAAKRFKCKSWISYEPAIGPLTMADCTAYPDQIIFGGESGNNRRECKQKWADNLLAECRHFGVKFFMKQMSARTPAEGKQLIPAHLLVQEFV